MYCQLCFFLPFFGFYCMDLFSYLLYCSLCFFSVLIFRLFASFSCSLTKFFYLSQAVLEVRPRFHRLPALAASKKCPVSVSCSWLLGAVFRGFYRLQLPLNRFNGSDSGSLYFFTVSGSLEKVPAPGSGSQTQITMHSNKCR